MILKFKRNVLEILKVLNDNGYEAYIVGGAVRNKLLGINIDDYDITTSATPDEIINLFSFTKVVPTGIKHGTITVFYNHVPYEITTFRIDGEYNDNRHPNQVEFVNNLEADLARRDFTINAMCYNQKLIDLFNGQEDLNNRIIRTVNDPNKRFEEDALRILRALRFSVQLNFSIENDTKEAIHNNKLLLHNISVERIIIELLHMFTYNDNYILNEFFDVFMTIVHSLKLESKEEVIRKFSYFDTIFEEKELLKLCYLLKDSAFTGSLYDKYKLSKKQIQMIKFVNTKLDICTDIIECKKILKNCDLNDIIFYINYNIENEEEKKKIKEAFKQASNECHRINMLQIRGRDLFMLNIDPKEYSNILNQVLDLVIEEKLPNDHDLILKYLENLKCL